MPRSFKEWQNIVQQRELEWYYGNNYSVGEYVYYDLMTSDAEKYDKPYLTSLHSEALAKRNNVAFTRNGFEGAAAIMSMAQAEAAKEMQMLSRIFGQDLGIKQLESADDVRQLVEAINSVFHFKSILERNKAMITSKEFKSNTKAVFSYYTSYLSRALKNHRDEILAQIKVKMSGNLKMEAGEAAKEVLNKLVPTLQQEALNYMFEAANVELKGMDASHKQAYKEILDAINKDFKATGNNIFLQRLYEIYRLDLIGDAFAEEMREQQGSYTRFSKARTNKAFNALKNRRISGLGGETVAQKGGYTLEALVDQAISMLISGINASNPNITAGTTAHTSARFAQLNSRSDNVLVFNASPQHLNQAIQSMTDDGFDRTRLKDAEYIQELTDKVTSVNDGYIVYFNDKNYSIGGGWGHRGAENVDLNTLSGMLSGLVTNIDDLIFNLLQAGDGAIGMKDEEANMEAIAQAIAFFLFDDYATIGVKSPGGQAIHILVLEGMMIPLSAYLFAMGKAMEDLGRHVKAWARASLSAPKILFPEHGSARFQKENWDVQLNSAMANTTIKVVFLQNMQSFVRRYL